MRKPPIKHKVRAHKREGNIVHNYVRGKGQKQAKIAYPTLPKSKKTFRYGNERGEYIAMGVSKQKFAEIVADKDQASANWVLERTTTIENSNDVSVAAKNFGKVVKLTPDGGKILETFNPKEEGFKLVDGYGNVVGRNIAMGTAWTKAVRNGYKIFSEKTGQEVRDFTR